VLSIIDHTSAVRPQKSHTLFDHAQIVVERRPQHIGDMQRPCLADDGAYRRLCIEHGLEIGIILRLTVRAAGHAERSDERMLPLYIACPLKELGVFGV